MHHVFSHRLLTALRRGCPVYADTSIVTATKHFTPNRWCVLSSAEGWVLFLYSPGSLEMTEKGRAAPTEAGQEALPPDWRTNVMCSFGGNHYCSLYICYNHEQVHCGRLDISALPCNVSSEPFLHASRSQDRLLWLCWKELFWPVITSVWCQEAA